MGGALILESTVLLRWLEREGYWPLGMTGISMGGYMASLAVTNWPKPIPLIPCLSWSTASSVFTTGVLSRAVNWAELEKQYAVNSVYETEIIKLLEYCGADSFKMGTELQRNVDSLGNLLGLAGALPIKDGRFVKVETQSEVGSSLFSSGRTVTGTITVGHRKKMNSHKCCRPSLHTESISFMKGVMDECTHMANFSGQVFLFGWKLGRSEDRSAMCDVHIYRRDSRWRARPRPSMGYMPREVVTYFRLNLFHIGWFRVLLAPIVFGRSCKICTMKKTQNLKYL
uniref:Abhydrolase domain containing 18 n=1 Tax=Poecilia formosa TaxID=48698 RepID=A0A096MBZ4_POEFO